MPTLSWSGRAAGPPWPFTSRIMKWPPTPSNARDSCSFPKMISTNNCPETLMADVLAQLAGFEEILKAKEPLAPFTSLKIGGSAEVLAQPRTGKELAALVQCCLQKQIPLRLLGGGCNLLVKD